MKTKGMAARFGAAAFGKVALVAAAICTVAMSALADVAMPHIVSHRGESQDRPENTMAAFRLAFERGVDGVECDVCCTSDGVPVIIHDSTTGRTAGSGTNLTVTASTWDQLKDVRVGAFSPWIGTEWEAETLPKFEDYLALLSMNSTTRCIVELKGNGANNLVQHVVAAVQAQPLATSNRVVFIAFDASLISAIRTALPDYQAWLLLNNGTYTGANLISRIEACNATGVDIDYQASVCVSAADVAAVKAAGYSFAVWTCDSDDTAFTLAQNGVEEITTNRGGEMKTSLAAMIAAAPVIPPSARRIRAVGSGSIRPERSDRPVRRLGECRLRSAAFRYRHAVDEHHRNCFQPQVQLLRPQWICRLMASGRALFRRQLKGGDYSQHNSWRCLDRPGHDDDEHEPAAHKQDVPGVAIPHRVSGV